VLEHEVRLDRVGDGEAASPPMRGQSLGDLDNLAAREATDGMSAVPAVRVVRRAHRRRPRAGASALGGRGTKPARAQGIAGQTERFFEVPAPDLGDERAGVTSPGMTIPIMQH